MSRRLASQFTEKAGGTRRAFPPTACAAATHLCPCVLPLFCHLRRTLCSGSPPVTGQGLDRVPGAISGSLLSPPEAFTSPGSVLPACKPVLTPLLRETFRPPLAAPSLPFLHTHAHPHVQIHACTHTPHTHTHTGIPQGTASTPSLHFCLVLTIQDSAPHLYRSCFSPGSPLCVTRMMSA